MKYMYFRAALDAVAPTDRERCAILGIHPRTLTRYKAGQLPPPLPELMRRPELLQALAQDAKRLNMELPAEQVA